MRQTIKPGAEIDALTESEVRKLFDEIRAGSTIEPSHVRAMASGTTDASGSLLLPVFEVPAGFGFALTRVLVRIAGATVAVPFTGAGAMLEVLRNDVMVDFKSLVAAALTPAGLPALMTYGRDSAAWFANGDVLQVRLTAVTANATVVATAEGPQSSWVVGN